MKVWIRGRLWKLDFVPALEDKNRGECDHPLTKGKAIRVLESLQGEERLEVIIHEMLHAAAWDLDEDAVAETAEDIARVLHRLGYRHKPA